MTRTTVVTARRAFGDESPFVSAKTIDVRPRPQTRKTTTTFLPRSPSETCCTMAESNGRAMRQTRPLDFG